LFARGDAGSRANDVPAAPAAPTVPTMNLRRRRVYVETESEKRARLDAEASTASS
jgi:hypothetical protein